MSDLEERAKLAIGPFVFGEVASLDLEPADALLVASWVTKSWMAYALTLPQQRNPFTVGEYRRFSNARKPLRRSRIWLLYNEGPKSLVGMQIDPKYIVRATGWREKDVNPATSQDNSAYCFLAVSHMIFYMQLYPKRFPWWSRMAFTPPVLLSARRDVLWPHFKKWTFPVRAWSDEQLEELLSAGKEWDLAMGVQIEGMNDEEVAAAERVGASWRVRLRR